MRVNNICGNNNFQENNNFFLCHCPTKWFQQAWWYPKSLCLALNLSPTRDTNSEIKVGKLKSVKIQLEIKETSQRLYDLSNCAPQITRRKQSGKEFARYRGIDWHLGSNETELVLLIRLISLLERTGTLKVIKAVSFWGK